MRKALTLSLILLVSLMSYGQDKKEFTPKGDYMIALGKVIDSLTNSNPLSKPTDTLSSKFPVVFSDNDADGINDFVDDDDDNDGILDVDENRVCDAGASNWIASWWMNSGEGSTANYVDTDATARDQTPGPGWDSWSIPTSSLYLNSTSLPQSLTEAVNGDFYIDYTILPGTGKAFEVNEIVWGFNDFVNVPKHDFKVTIYSNKDNYTTPLLQDISRPNDVDNYIWMSNPMNNVMLRDISDSLVFRVYVYEPTVGIGGAAITNGTIVFDDFLLAGYHMVLDDCDSDGIPNIYDTDDDDDGCYDAIEAAMNFNPNDVDGNGALTGGVDTDGVPLVVSGGQAITTDVTDPNDKSECPCPSVLTNRRITKRVFRE